MRYKRGIEAINRGDIEALLEDLDPEVEWHPVFHEMLGGEAACIGDTRASATRSETGTRRSGRFTSILGYQGP